MKAETQDTPVTQKFVFNERMFAQLRTPDYERAFIVSYPYSIHPDLTAEAQEAFLKSFITSYLLNNVINPDDVVRFYSENDRNPELTAEIDKYHQVYRTTVAARAASGPYEDASLPPLEGDRNQLQRDTIEYLIRLFGGSEGAFQEEQALFSSLNPDEFYPLSGNWPSITTPNMAWMVIRDMKYEAPIAALIMLDYHQNKGKEVTIRQMFVTPEHWGIGMGESLLYAVRSFVQFHLHGQEPDDYTMRLEVRRANPAKGLYERVGFTPLAPGDPHAEYPQDRYVAMSRTMFTRDETLRAKLFLSPIRPV